MKIRIKKANLKRLASLSALGAGALGAAAGTAEASSIVFSGPVDAHVGFCKHCLGSFDFSGPGGALWQVFGRAYCNTSSCLHSVFADLAKSGKHGTFLDFVQAAFPQGAGWSSHGPTGNHASIAFSGFARSGGPHNGTSPFNATDRYVLFRFSGGDLSHDIYGWAQLDVRFGPHANLDVTLVDYAYDTCGNQLPAGDTGTPEPSTFVLTGLAALIMGAKGLRAWRREAAKMRQRS